MPFFSSFFSYGEISLLLQNVINEFSLSPERMVIATLLSLIGIYIAQWYGKKITNITKKISFNIILLIIITLVTDFIIFVIPV